MKRVEFVTFLWYNKKQYSAVSCGGVREVSK